MDFPEAERRFQWLEKQRASGALSLDKYRSEVHKLRVTDAQGRVWMPQEQTGRWHVYQEGQWVVAQPPHLTAASSSPPPRSEASQQQPPAQPDYVAQSQAKKGGGCGKTVLYLIGWGVLWLVVAVAVFLIWGEEEPLVLLGVALAAFISLVMMLINLSSNWSEIGRAHV